jgi:hypothetical protein
MLGGLTYTELKVLELSSFLSIARSFRAVQPGLLTVLIPHITDMELFLKRAICKGISGILEAEINCSSLLSGYHVLDIFPDAEDEPT